MCGRQIRLLPTARPSGSAPLEFQSGASPKSHPSERSHSRSTACQCGKNATSSTEARLEIGTMSSVRPAGSPRGRCRSVDPDPRALSVWGRFEVGTNYESGIRDSCLGILNLELLTYNTRNDPGANLGNGSDLSGNAFTRKSTPRGNKNSARESFQADVSVSPTSRRSFAAPAVAIPVRPSGKREKGLEHAGRQTFTRLKIVAVFE